MTTPYRPQLHSQADLEEVWRHLISPLGCHRRSVWLMLIDAEGRPTSRRTTALGDRFLPDAPRTADWPEPGPGEL